MRTYFAKSEKKGSRAENWDRFLSLVSPRSGSGDLSSKLGIRLGRERDGCLSIQILNPLEYTYQILPFLKIHRLVEIQRRRLTAATSAGGALAYVFYRSENDISDIVQRSSPPPKLEISFYHELY